MTERTPHPDPHPLGPPDRPPGVDQDGVSRRSFIQTLGVSAAAGAVGSAAGTTPAENLAPETDILGPDPFEVTLRVNGNDLKATIDPATTLLEALRAHHRLTGTKEICDRGACGGCSVIIDGALVVSCMMLAHDAVGREITTVEGLVKNRQLDPIQEAFIEHDALQCGYCTPGLVMASRVLLDGNPTPTLEEIKAGLSGNLCRCGTYTNIFNAVLQASGQKPVQDQGGAVS